MYKHSRPDCSQCHFCHSFQFRANEFCNKPFIISFTASVTQQANHFMPRKQHVVGNKDLLP